MGVDPVSQRFTMTQDQFNGLSKADQQRVLDAKLMDRIMKPMLDKAVSRMREGSAQKTKAMQGETD
jgi:hypothetical protein